MDIKRKIWVEIFDSLFGKNKDQFDFKINETPKIPDEIKDVISKLQNMTDESFNNEEIDGIFKSEMGEPSQIIEYTEGNIDYTKKVWETKDGKIVRIMATTKDGVKYEDLSLDEKLEMAIQNEDYEEAAKIKEKIENKNFIDNIGDNQEDTE